MIFTTGYEIPETDFPYQKKYKVNLERNFLGQML
jgi:hypothetical protein